MPVITEGQLAVINPAPFFRSVGVEFLPTIHGNFTTYDWIYRTQPTVKAVVDFLAKNLAQLRIKTYERINDTDRKYLKDHPTQTLMDFPAGRFQSGLTNPSDEDLALLLARDQNMGRRQSRQRFYRDVWSDFLIYDRALIVKMRDPSTNRVRVLKRIPPSAYAVISRNWLAPIGFSLRYTGEKIDIVPSDAIYFTGYSPASDVAGVSPLESLRRTLVDDDAMTEYRNQFWNNAARYSNVIERPVESPEMSPEAIARFLEKWKSRGSGVAAGSTGFLDEGMKLHELQFSNGDVSSFISSRKLNNEEIARAFGVPRALVDMLDTGQGPFSAGIDSYRQFLYSEVLAPLLPVVSEQFELDLLAEWEIDAGDDVYLEYDLDEKLRGNFETIVKSAQASVGRPWRTVNEQRATENLPAVDGGDELTIPLNVAVVGGPQASPADTAPPAVAPPGTPPKMAAKSEDSRIMAATRARDRYASQGYEALSRFFDRQARSVLSSKTFNTDRWNSELTDLLFGLAKTFVDDAATRESGKIGLPYDDTRTFTFLKKHVEETAGSINFVTQTLLESANGSNDGRKLVFEALKNGRGQEIALTFATSWNSFGTREIAYQNGNHGSKKWVTTTEDSRHASLDGQTVSVDEAFSNGAAYPGDFNLPTEERANCKCVLVVE